MTALPVSIGPCIGCEREFKKQYIKKHIKSCRSLHQLTEEANVATFHDRMEQIIPDYVDVGPFPVHSKRHNRATIPPPTTFVPVDRVPAFFILVFGGPYWMVLLVPKLMKLHYLDRFLRRTWLECCCHLSRFDIKEDTYHCPSEMTAVPLSSASGMFYKEEVKVMTDYHIQDLLKVGDKFQYTYDFGTCTWLDFEVFDETTTPTVEEVFVVARNRSPNFDCSQCSSTIPEGVHRYVVKACGWCGDGLCETCSANHDCEAIRDLISKGREGPFDPDIVDIYNSPRSGDCGYCGPISEDYYA